jgi:hypothetical protein
VWEKKKTDSSGTVLCLEGVEERQDECVVGFFPSSEGEEVIFGFKTI